MKRARKQSQSLTRTAKEWETRAQEREREVFSTDSRATTCVGLLSSENFSDWAITGHARPGDSALAAFFLDACKRSLTIKAHTKRHAEHKERKQQNIFSSLGRQWPRSHLPTMIGTFIHYEEKSSAQRIKGSDNGSTASYRKTLTLRISLVYKSDRCRKMASWWVTTVRPCVAMQFRLGNAGCVFYLGHTSHTNARTITKMVNNGRSLTYNTKRKKKKKYISLWTSWSTYQYKEGSRPEIRSPGLADSSLFPSTLVPPTSRGIGISRRKGQLLSNIVHLSAFLVVRVYYAK